MWARRTIWGPRTRWTPASRGCCSPPSDPELTSSRSGRSTHLEESATNGWKSRNLLREKEREENCQVSCPKIASFCAVFLGKPSKSHSNVRPSRAILWPLKAFFWGAKKQEAKDLFFPPKIQSEHYQWLKNMRVHWKISRWPLRLSGSISSTGRRDSGDSVLSWESHENFPKVAFFEMEKDVHHKVDVYGSFSYPISVAFFPVLPSAFTRMMRKRRKEEKEKKRASCLSWWMMARTELLYWKTHFRVATNVW